MIKQFIHQGQEFSIYTWKEKNEPLLQQGFKNKDSNLSVDHSWKISLTGNGPFPPIKTGLGLKKDTEELVILSAQIRTQSKPYPRSHSS